MICKKIVLPTGRICYYKPEGSKKGAEAFLVEDGKFVAGYADDNCKEKVADFEKIAVVVEDIHSNSYYNTFRNIDMTALRELSTLPQNIFEKIYRESISDGKLRSSAGACTSRYEYYTGLKIECLRSGKNLPVWAMLANHHDMYPNRFKFTFFAEEDGHWRNYDETTVTPCDKKGENHRFITPMSFFSRLLRNKNLTT